MVNNHNKDSQLDTGNILFIISRHLHKPLALSSSKCSYDDVAEPLGERLTAIDKAGLHAINNYFNNLAEKQAINKPVNHVQSRTTRE